MIRYRWAIKKERLMMHQKNLKVEFFGFKKSKAHKSAIYSIAKFVKPWLLLLVVMLATYSNTSAENALEYQEWIMIVRFEAKKNSEAKDISSDFA